MAEPGPDADAPEAPSSAGETLPLPEPGAERDPADPPEPPGEFEPSEEQTLPLPEEVPGSAIAETAELPASERDGEAGARPASWKDRLRLRLKDHEEERQTRPPPTAIVSTRFDVVRELGRGGMGVVLEAEDTVLKRRVALKVLLAGEFASPQALERFQIEARAAARLRHPNIVGVLEVGEEGGRQFLVMDLIEGEALDKRLRRDGPFDADEAARIAHAIADALAFAHERGVLHRDIKPANILLADGKPLLTDFGLAKEIERSVEVGNLTSSGHVMGTPAYMSPEQARGEPDAIGRRTDIYSLGATLYEMLVGRPPFTGASLPSVLTAVANEEPTAISALRPGLDRDLETICLKCLEKEPERRYAGAEELRADLERFLRHESIHARRPSMSERARKWLRRNRIMARTLGFSAGAGLVLVGVLTGVYIERLEREQARYERAAAEARDALDVLVFGVRDELGDVPGERVREVRQRLLRGAIEKLERLQELEPDAGKRSLKTAAAYRQIGALALEAGDLTKAGTWFDKAVAVSRQLIARPRADEDSRRDLTASLLRAIDVRRRRSQLAQARSLTDEALEHARALVAAFRSSEARLDLARVLCRDGDLHAKSGSLARAAESFQEATELARRSLTTSGSRVAARELSSTSEALGDILEGQGDLIGAERAFGQGIRIARALLASQPDSLQYQRDLLSSLSQVIRIKSKRGDLSAAQTLADEGLKLARKLHGQDTSNALLLHGLTITLVLRGDVQSARGDAQAAIASYREAIAVGRRLHQLEPSNVEFDDCLSGALERLGIMLRQQGELEPGAKISEEVVRRARALRARGDTLRARNQLANSLTNHAILERERGNLKQALALHQEALQLRQELVAKDPTNRGVLNALGSSWSGLGDVHRDREELDPALQAYRSAVAARRKVLARDGRNTLARKGLSIGLQRIGAIELQRGNRAAAAEALAEALKSDRARVKQDPTDATARENLATVLMTLGDLHLRAKELSQAREHFTEARDLRAGIIKASPGNVNVQREYLISLSRIADIELAEGNLPQAGETYAEMLRIHRARLAADPKNAETLRDVSVALIKAGDLEERRKRGAQALAHFREAVPLMQRRLELDETNAGARRDLYIASTRVGKLAYALAKYKVAEAALLRAVKLGQLLSAKSGEMRTLRNVSAILLKLADVRRMSGDPLGARAYLQRAVKNHAALAERDPRLQGQVAQLRAILRRHEAKIAYLTGARAPETPQEHLELAYELVRRGELAKSLPQFTEALKDEAIRGSPKGHRFHAACAAARIEDDPAARKQALAWLQAHVKELRQRVKEAKEHLAKPDLEQAHRAQLTTYVKQVTAHLKQIRDTEPDLASLRGEAAFRSLFAE